MSVSPYPTYEDCVSESMDLSKNNTEFVRYEEIGQSTKGRSIPMITITDSSVPLEEKSVFLMTGGTDGDEEVGRAIALEYAKELLKPEHQDRLKKNHILIVPVTNPDGTVGNLQDKMGNGSGIGASSVHMPGKEPATEEGKAMRHVMEEFIPDAHIDFHGLAGGSMGDCSYLYPTINEKFSVPTLYEVNKRIEEAAAAAGFPQQGCPRLWSDPRYNTPGWLARNYSTFAMIMEGTENYYPIEDSAASGVLRLLKLMDIGSEIGFFQDYANYPCDLINGGKMGALMSSGSNYTQRRKSRRDCSLMILEGVYYFGRVINDYNWEAVIELPVNDDVKTIPEALSFKAILDKRVEIKSVSWADHLLEDDLWSIEDSAEGQIVRAHVPEAPKFGKNRLTIKYDAPYKRHVEPKQFKPKK